MLFEDEEMVLKTRGYQQIILPLELATKEVGRIEMGTWFFLL